MTPYTMGYSDAAHGRRYRASNPETYDLAAYLCGWTMAHGARTSAITAALMVGYERSDAAIMVARSHAHARGATSVEIEHSVRHCWGDLAEEYPVRETRGPWAAVAGSQQS